MKRYLTIILILLITVTACKLDEAGFRDSAPTNNELLGIWYIKYQSSYTPSLPQMGTYVVTDFTPKDYYMFGADGICKYSIAEADTIITSNYTYNKAAKKIIFGPEPEDIFTITKLTTDSLIVNGIATADANGQTTITNLTIKFARR